MIVLGIETSCDETAAAVVEDGIRVQSNVIASSREAFERSGGVIPEEAARRQVECILPVLEQTLDGIGMTARDLEAIAVTRGPGLLGSLLVGTTTARLLGSIWKLPVVGVHHTLGHLSSTWLETAATSNDPTFPVLTLSASGGHTELWLRTAHTQGQLLGRTRDDAAGEAFDKGASLLGLPYPGGPAITAAAEDGDPSAFDFPLPLKREETLDFSFSGLKTALRYLLRDMSGQLTTHSLKIKADLAASYQHALCLHLVDRIERALAEYPQAREVHLVGGVSANRHLRSLAKRAISNRRLRFPTRLSSCTDNAAMIAAAAFFLIQERGMPTEEWETEASLPLTMAITAS